MQVLLRIAKGNIKAALIFTYAIIVDLHKDINIFSDKSLFSRDPGLDYHIATSASRPPMDFSFHRLPFSGCLIITNDTI